MKVGIIFGGKSREREVSFAGGRTVFDSLDKDLFDPIPIFIDSWGNFIHLDWQYLYKGSIRDFYPPIQALPESPNGFQVYAESLGPLSEAQQLDMIQAIGTPIQVEDLPKMIDFAFLCLHGPYGEDGTVQGILEFIDIPFSGAGILPSSIGIDKSVQKNLFNASGFSDLAYKLIPRNEWLSFESQKAFYKEVCDTFQFPLVVKSASQGSSIGVNILKEKDFERFRDLVNRSFFIREISANYWAQLTEEEEVNFVRDLVDLQDGLATPVVINEDLYYHPEAILKQIRESFVNNPDENASITIASYQSEHTVIIEQLLEGKEFSCIVIQDEKRQPLALPPTEIRKASEVFDYRAKYLPGVSHKITPINLPDEALEKIRKACEKLFQFLHSNVYARIDGFFTPDEEVYLNDPNTTSGMLPSSFFFHQAAEIGLTPSQFLTYIIRTSLLERQATTYPVFKHQISLKNLDENIENQQGEEREKVKVGVILGGYSSERHISVESGRNVFEKLASSQRYAPIPIFLTQEYGEMAFYKIPVNLLLKDNADDINEKVTNFKMPGKIQDIIEEAGGITEKYSAAGYAFYPEAIPLKDFPDIMDFAFLGLHGQPGEDGTLPREFEKMQLPYNGSDPNGGALTIDKYKTNNLLKSYGIEVANNFLVTKQDWYQNPDKIWKAIEGEFGYPFVAKPSDDGCSSAVKKIDTPEKLKDYLRIIFRDQKELPDLNNILLDVKPNEEFPAKDYFMVEEKIEKGSAQKLLEITCGLVTHFDEEGHITFEIFEPSEALAEEGILSLEEKFLAGEGQNITPARFANDPAANKRIAEKVKSVIKRVAEITDMKGYCRIDAFVRVYDNEKVDVIIIEINSLPGLTPATAIFHQAALNNYKPVEFLGQIIDFGKKKMNTLTQRF